MSLNSVPSSSRVHIGFFGLRNAGKSSVVNAVTGQQLSVVSDIKGTTTDPVQKAMEILPLGPVVIIDTPGMDDEGKLGNLRIQKTKEALGRSDIAVLIVDATIGLQAADHQLIQLFQERNTPYIIVYNKSDLLDEIDEIKEHEIYVSAKTNNHIYELKEKIAHLIKNNETSKQLVSDLLTPGDVVVLVIPIDSSAPKGRLILPQQQVIRDVLESGCIVVACREIELSETLTSLKTKPKLVITDSQAFKKVDKDVPNDILLTSFSILFARFKGSLKNAIIGAKQLDQLDDGDIVLISEGCTHHRQCEDIGTVKLPRWVQDYTHKNLQFEFTSGREFPEDLSKYKLVIHCGGCMLNEKEMKYRVNSAMKQHVSITNYGITIAYLNGILKRSLRPFKDMYQLLSK